MGDTRYLIGLLSRVVGEMYETAEAVGPVGCVLSGGLDSSTVACLMGDAPTFTGYYDEPGFDERKYARMVNWDTSVHHEILITPEDFVENFDAMVAAIRPPYQGMGTFGQFMVGKHIAENTDVRVLFSGEGSDELFGGYPRLMAVAGAPLPDNYAGYQPPPGYPTDIRQALDYDFDRLGLLLAVDDQCMAAHGLTAMAPFTDERIVAYAHGLPLFLRVGKRHLRDTVRGIVPDPIINRTDNMGFPAPLVAWAQREPVRSFVKDRIDYTPDPSKPWAREWWHELIEVSAKTPKLARVPA
jgi:asparagine synthetase B (glutamine-hydrolysing)